MQDVIVKFLQGVISDGTKTSEELVIFNFEIWLRHTKHGSSKMTNYENIFLNYEMGAIAVVYNRGRQSCYCKLNQICDVIVQTHPQFALGSLYSALKK